MAFSREGSGRVALSFIGEGGSSLGEWHEAINLCAARRLPAVFCIENNQTALSTSVSRTVRGSRVCGQGRRLRHSRHHDRRHRSRTRWRRRSRGRRIARAPGSGPRSSSSCPMRMCGHAHHDDMLYLGKEPRHRVGLSDAVAQARTRIASCTAFWAARGSDRRPTRRGSRAAGIIDGLRRSSASSRKRSSSSRPKRGP